MLQQGRVEGGYIDYRLQAAGGTLLAAGCRLQAVCCRLYTGYGAIVAKQAGMDGSGASGGMRSPQQRSERDHHRHRLR